MRGLGPLLQGVLRETGQDTHTAIKTIANRLDATEAAIEALPPRALAEPVDPAAFVAENADETRTFDTATVTTEDLAKVVATLLADLKAAKIVG